VGLKDPDMNDDSNLELYSQLYLFKNTSVKDELIFYDPNKERQRVLQSLAHKLDLECEYSLDTRIVRITRSSPENGESSESQNFDLVGIGNFGDGDGLFDNFLGLEAVGSEDFVAGSPSWTAIQEVNNSMPGFERTAEYNYLDEIYPSLQFTSMLPTISSAPDVILEQQLRTVDNQPLNASPSVKSPLTIPPEELSDPLDESYATPWPPPSLVSKKRKNSDRSLSPQHENKRPDEGGISSAVRLNSQAGPFAVSLFPSVVKKPTGTSADTRTYTCTYHGCTSRFDTPAKLQRHKREEHRSASIGDKDTITSAARLNSQDGPFRVS
jgi:hypothetical protein